MLSNTYYVELDELEDLDVAEARIMRSMLFHAEKHKDFSAVVVKNIEENYIKVSTLRLEAEVN